MTVDFKITKIVRVGNVDLCARWQIICCGRLIAKVNARCIDMTVVL